MNESTVSSAFQKKLREALPDAVVIKHADKSMIGLLDASVTYNKKTLWIEYKLVQYPVCKGVTAQFMVDGSWSTEDIAAESSTQYQKAKDFAVQGHCIYLFWVLDYKARRKKVGYIVAWHPITKDFVRLENNSQAVTFVSGILHGFAPNM